MHDWIRARLGMCSSKNVLPWVHKNQTIEDRSWELALCISVALESRETIARITSIIQSFITYPVQYFIICSKKYVYIFREVIGANNLFIVYTMFKYIALILIHVLRNSVALCINFNWIITRHGFEDKHWLIHSFKHYWPEEYFLL